MEETLEGAAPAAPAGGEGSAPFPDLVAVEVDPKNFVAFSAPAPRPVFPVTVHLGGARVTVHADGRVEGDAGAVEAHLASLASDFFGGSDPIPLILMALLGREIRRQREGGP